jgi:hypothetical protein
MDGLIKTRPNVRRGLASVENFKGGRHVLERFAPFPATLKV